MFPQEIAQRYVEHHNINVLTLRPRAFIPYWNKTVYSSFVEWAKWFWKGAVHINDVAQAVMQGIDLISTKKGNGTNSFLGKFNNFTKPNL